MRRDYLVTALAGSAAGIIILGAYGVLRRRGVIGPSLPFPGPESPEGWDEVTDVCDATLTQALRGAHAAARPIMLEAFPVALGRPPRTLWELQYSQGVAFAETSYGRGWPKSSALSACNNWGAVQCTAAQAGKAGTSAVSDEERRKRQREQDTQARANLEYLNAQEPEQGRTAGPDCVAHEDSHSSGRKYAVSFRCYAGPVEGAADVVRHVIKNRPRTAEALGAERATVFRASYAMRREKYYGGFCPNATKQYGTSAAEKSFAKPDDGEGNRACAEEAITAHAIRLHSIMRQIACTMGEKTIPLGTYKDAAAWYSGGNNA